MIQILAAIAPLFLIIFATALLQKYTNIGDRWSTTLNEYALNIGLPALVFASLAKTAISFSEEIMLIILNSAFILAGLTAAYLIGKILRLRKEMFRTLFICFIFGNIAYLGLPVLLQTAGEKILPIASLIIAVYSFWIFTIGVGYLDYSIEKNKKAVAKKIIKNFFRNPLLLSVILGLIVGSLTINLPSILLKSLDMLTASVTPTVLIVIGLFIGKSKIGTLLEWLPVILFSFLTLVILPAGFYFGVKLLGFSPSQFSSSIIEAAMPLAITPFALADKYNLDKNFIARSIVLSTILSVISLPFWISIL